MHREPWDKGKTVDQKAPFKLKDRWELRVRRIGPTKLAIAHPPAIDQQFSRNARELDRVHQQAMAISVRWKLLLVGVGLITAFMVLVAPPF